MLRLIEAYWNVNGQDEMINSMIEAFNRSILKCKSPAIIPIIHNVSSLIEAYWNVNTTKGVGDSDLAMFNRSILKCKLYREE